MTDDMGTCWLGDNFTIDEVLMDYEDPMLVDEVMAAAMNPAEWALAWPEKPGWRRDKATGEMKPYIRRPTGLFTHAKLGGPVQVRIKISVEIGMLVIDRAWGTSCTWKTDFCKKHCYNKALKAMRPNLKKTAAPDEAFWRELDGQWLYDILHSERFDHFSERMGYSSAFMRGRLRLASRGEAFSQPDDIMKIADLCVHNPQTVFWIPTRAWWKDEAMADAIEEIVMPLANARVLASTDPSNTAESEERIIERGWSTMFFGDNTATQERFACPKTWQKKKSYCRVCKNGCFRAGHVDVHLKVHGTKVNDEELLEYRLRHGLPLKTPKR